MVSAKRAKLITVARVRRAFLDFFSQRNHDLVPGSPVLPLGDPSVPFVPAGMHQFRNVLLGKAPPPAPQVANSQRCIRVGGRHCDLATVGTDGSHLTFFEMLGSWTFGASSYWKRQVCADALDLLTGPLSVDPSRIGVTYFGGDSNVGLDADLECHDVWRSLGIPEDRVRPCPAADNMWEMGASGPCGPCTEIHVDGVEIWNLVFIQQQRSIDGTLSPLEYRSIDTGMGLERLTALLAGRSSVFDTDAFTRLIDTVNKRTGIPPYTGAFDDSEAGRRDAVYRLLVDHARMIAVSLADGVVPDRQHKLRRIIRRCMLIAERLFVATDSDKVVELVEELAIRTIEALQDAHPSLTEGIPATRQLLRYEVNLFSQLRKKESRIWTAAVAEEPRLAALAEAGIPRDPLALSWRIIAGMSSKGFRTLPGNEAYRIYDTHGLVLDVLDELAQLTGMQGVDAEGFRAARTRVHDASRLRRALGGTGITLNDVGKLLPQNLPATDTTPVYSYSRSEVGKYSFPSVQSEVLALVQDGVLVKEAILGGGPVGAVMSTTNMYRARGGQEADHGVFESASGSRLQIVEPMDVNQVVVHWGELSGAPLSVGDKGEVRIDADRRLSLMCNHTAVHLFNQCLRQHVPIATQKLGPVTSTWLKLALNSYGKRLSVAEFQSVEEATRALVRSSLPVSRQKVTTWNWYVKPITIIPDADYPLEDLSVVEIGDESRELCGGTHVFNTADVQEVCVIKIDERGVPVVTAVTGERATAALKAGTDLLNRSEAIAADALTAANLVDGKNPVQFLEHYWKCRAAIDAAAKFTECSYFTQAKSVSILEKAAHAMEDSAKTGVRLEVAEAAAAAAGRRFATVLVRYASILDKVQLNKSTRPLPDTALLLVAVLRDGSIRARCCVPDDLISSDFDAQRWLSLIASALGGRAVSRDGVDPMKACVFETTGSSKLTAKNIETAVEEAHRFAENVLLQRVSCA